MKRLYELDKASHFGIFLIYFFMTVASMLVTDSNLSQMPTMGKYLKLVLFAVGALVIFAIIYGLFVLLLKNNSNYKPALLVNMSLCLALGGLLSAIVYLIAGKSNIWVNGIVGFISLGGLALLNWKTLEVPQSDKVKITVLAAIVFVLSLF